MKTKLSLLLALLCWVSISVYAQKEENPLNYPYYILGTQNVNSMNSATLSNIEYKGFSSSAGDVVYGSRNKDEKFLYQFNDITTNPEIDIENKTLTYWREDEDGVWMADSESGNGTANTRLDLNSCFMLILDYSSSLGAAGLSGIKQGAIEFVERMYRSSNPEIGNIKIGIISFSTMEDTKVFPITSLTRENRVKMINFIQNANLPKKATSMYYAINKGIDLLKEYTNENRFSDLEGTHFITFTDGLDNTSQLEREGLIVEKEVSKFVENKMATTSIHGIDIDSWVIGVQGNDVTDRQLNRMKSKLSVLASSNSQFIWLNDFSELTEAFARIANSLTRKWTNLQCTSALNHSGRVCWTYGSPRYVAPKPLPTPKTKRDFLFGLNLGVGYAEEYDDYYDEYYDEYYDDSYGNYKVTLGLDLAFPITKKFSLGGYTSFGYAVDYLDFNLGALAAFGDHDVSKLKYLVGLGVDACGESIGADLRFGLMFRNGLYLMADGSFGDMVTGFTINIGYNFGKLFK